MYFPFPLYIIFDIWKKMEESNIEITLTAYLEKGTYGRMVYLICEVVPYIEFMKLLCCGGLNRSIQQQMLYYRHISE